MSSCTSAQSCRAGLTASTVGSQSLRAVGKSPREVCSAPPPRTMLRSLLHNALPRRRRVYPTTHHGATYASLVRGSRACIGQAQVSSSSEHQGAVCVACESAGCAYHTCRHTRSRAPRVAACACAAWLRTTTTVAASRPWRLRPRRRSHRTVFTWCVPFDAKQTAAQLGRGPGFAADPICARGSSCAAIAGSRGHLKRLTVPVRIAAAEHGRAACGTRKTPNISTWGPAG